MLLFIPNIVRAERLQPIEMSNLVFDEPVANGLPSTIVKETVKIGDTTIEREFTITWEDAIDNIENVIKFENNRVYKLEIDSIEYAEWK